MIPFYWHDVDNLSGYAQWLYRVCVTLAFICFALVVCGLIVAVVDSA